MTLIKVYPLYTLALVSVVLLEVGYFLLVFGSTASVSGVPSNIITGAVTGAVTGAGVSSFTFLALASSESKYVFKDCRYGLIRSRLPFTIFLKSKTPKEPAPCVFCLASSSFLRLPRISVLYACSFS